MAGPRITSMRSAYGLAAMCRRANSAWVGEISQLVILPPGASPYADRIEVILGPAIDTIATVDGPFDLVFIDADKAAYPDYYEAVLPKLAPGGLIAADNTLWSGRILDPSDTSADTVALRRFNDALAADPRVVVVQTTVRDGVTLIRRAG
jgi:caffeoyl-CoA O-methyltransferase